LYKLFDLKELNGMSKWSNFFKHNDEFESNPREKKEVVFGIQLGNSYTSFHFIVILSLSTIIATFGLAANSAVVIVGAMLIAPLMKPIISLSYAIVTKDWPLRIRSLITLAIGIICTILLAAIVETVLGLKEPTVEILARIQPNLIDLGIAIAAGIAATLAATRRNIGETLPGVAIAVSIVPPLCVCGIGLYPGSMLIATGSILLFFVNLVSIVLTAVIVFLFEKHGSIINSWKSLLVILFISALQAIPLTEALGKVKDKDMAQLVVEDYLHEQYPIDGIIHPGDLERLDIIKSDDHIFVFLEMKVRPDGVSEKKISELHARLSKAFQLPVNLKIQVLLSQELYQYSHLSSDGTMPDYGTDSIIPRK